MARFSELAPGFVNQPRLAGLLFVVAFLLFAIGATLPLLGPKGNLRFFGLPQAEYLANVSGNAAVWRWANVFMGAAAVTLLCGLGLLTAMLENANEQVLSRLGLLLFLLATILWVIFSAWRGVVAVEAGREMVATGAVPSYYAPLAKWNFAMFFIYAALGFLALAAYGGSLLQTGLVPAWAAWSILVFSFAMLAVLLAKGDNLPAFHYLPPLLVGIILLLRG